MAREQTQHEAKEVSKARGAGVESASWGFESGAPLPAQARPLLSLQSTAGNRAVAGLVQRRNDTGLPDGLKAGIESLSGMSLDGVRVHRNSAEPAQLDASAFARGSDIHVAPGQERHLPHEAWHVVQQAQGRVKPTMQLKRGALVNDDERLEQEADVMGAQALAQAGTSSSSEAPAEPLRQHAPTVQRKYELCDEADVTAIGNDHRAKKVRAENIGGRTLGAAANSPSVPTFGWEQLKAAGHTLANRTGANTHYNAVRAHLMNGRLGGPGDEKWNLAPAPAQINSMMSAGPETAAKNLVDAGHKIWLETTVSYHGNSTNAHDFTSVVPNHIVMEWGVMGSTAKTTWSAAIDLPVAPLQGLEAQKYKDWDSGKAAELVHDLSTKSNQVRAQAFELVSHDNLKFEILKAYPSVYLSMERLTKGKVLGGLDEKLRLELLTILGVVTSPDQLVEEAILPLAEAGYVKEAQKLFAGLGDSDQRAVLISWKNELLAHLGALGDAWSKRDYTIFRYNGPISRAAIVNGMSATELTTFLAKLSKTQRIQILDEWAELTFMVTDLNTKNDKVKANANIKKSYRTEYDKWVAAQNRAAQYMRGRPKREPKVKAKSPKRVLAAKKPHHNFKRKRTSN